MCSNMMTSSVGIAGILKHLVIRVKYIFYVRNLTGRAFESQIGDGERYLDTVNMN